MRNDIIKLIEEYKGLKLISGPYHRKDRDLKNEAGKIIKSGDEFYDCTLEYQGKKFPVTFVPEENIKDTLVNCLRQHNIQL